jgi:hypothetical protein
MKVYADSYRHGITSRVQSRQTRRSLVALSVLVLTTMAFFSPVITFGLDGLSTIVQGALTSTDIGERNPSVAWSAYLVAYAILLIGSVVLWLWAIALTIRPPGGRNKGESSEKPLDLMP